MPDSHTARRSARRTRWAILTSPVVASAALLTATGCQSPSASLTSTATSPAPIAAEPLAHRPPTLHPAEPQALPSEAQGAAGVVDGVVPAGVTVFSDEFPAVTNLDPALRSALREAGSQAASDGVVFYVNSGWRSPKYQQQLLQEAISKYGSEREAARWVATPSTSAHVTGKAVDIGPSDAPKWLSEHGAQYGLCQIYQNEAWHYELRPDAIDHGCPAMYADPTHDPRMHE